VSAPKRQAEPEFRPDEYLETLLRIKRDQPRRYVREVSLGQQRRVELYEERKAQAAVRAKAA
jgi:ABC-type multidrug transport system ATPase subunit